METTGLPSQYAALPWKARKSGLKILLVTSRETRRFVLPKGWPIPGLKPHRVAEREAWEEAGVVGKAARTPVGAYTYWKRMRDSFVLCNVDVFPLEVKDLEDHWQERGERERLWLSSQEAAAVVAEPGLAHLLRTFSPALVA